MTRVANPLLRLVLWARGRPDAVRRVARAASLVAWQARTLLVLMLGTGLVAAGAAMVFTPAGLIVAGALLLVMGWPDRPAEPNGEQ